MRKHRYSNEIFFPLADTLCFQKKCHQLTIMVLQMQSSRKKNIGVASVGGKNPLSNLTSSVSGLLSDIVLWSTANFSPSPFANPHYSTRISYISLSFSLPPPVCSFIRQWLFFQSQFGVAVPFAPFDHSSPAQQLEQQL